MLNIHDKTLNYYQEIFRFIVQTDEYQQYIYLRIKLLTPYSADDVFFVGPLKDYKPPGDGMTLVSLAKQLKIRVRKKFGFKLQTLSEWDRDLEDLDIFSLLNGPHPVITVPVKAQQRHIDYTEDEQKRLNLDHNRCFIIGIHPNSPKKELLQSIDIALRSHIKPMNIRRKKAIKSTSPDTLKPATKVMAQKSIDNSTQYYTHEPVIITPIVDPRKQLQCSKHDLHRLNMDSHKFFFTSIDPSFPKKELLQSIDLALREYLKPQKKRRPKAVKIPRGDAFRLARLGHTFKEIGIQFSATKSAAFKAFIRDFADVYDEVYKSVPTNRKAVPSHQLIKTCATCADKNTCKKLCPEISAFVDQEYISLKELPVEQEKLAYIFETNDLLPVFR